ncbi:MAG: hypothetical protein LBT79_08380 [Elusimicrobiota bacterium]|jgi:hypothetical protein|nr:hypothetical protein [Elusimicrobiota bacterium]
MNIILTEEEANTLLLLEKHYKDDKNFDFPALGGSIRIPLFSSDNREEFSLDITRAYVRLNKNSMQHRVRRTMILARIDIEGASHTNPDDKEIPCPHIHLYKEGFNDKWAYPLPNTFSNTNDILKTLDEFMNYCHIVTKPIILSSKEGLFL